MRRYKQSILMLVVFLVLAGGAILLAHKLFGQGVIAQFYTADGLLAPAELPKTTPGSWDIFWNQISGQVSLVRRMCETYGRVNWLSWNQLSLQGLSSDLNVSR